MDEDDQLARQQAMDAAVAVAAAAAAAQQSQADADGAQQPFADASLTIDQGQEPLQEEQQDEGLQEEGAEAVQPMTEVDEGQADEMLTVGDIQPDEPKEEHEEGAPEQQVQEDGNDVDELGDYTQDSVVMPEASGMHHHPSQLYENVPIEQYEEADYAHPGMASASQHSGQTTSNRPLTHHTKRRKINTCLPCKRRKVKCDRQKPHCGQCRKSQIPMEDCTWSAPVEHTVTQASTSQREFPAAEVAGAMEASGSTVNGSQWYGTPPDGNAQALMERITALEAALASSQGRLPGGVNGGRDTGAWGEGKGTLLAHTSEAERGMAADTLTMIAQQTSATFEDATRLGKLKYRRLFPSDGVPTWARGDSFAAKGKEAVGLLPEVKVIQMMLQAVDGIHGHGMSLGISIKLLEAQIETLNLQVFGANERAPSLDLSFVAALLFLFAVAADLLPTEQMVSAELAETEEGVQEAIDSWMSAGDRLLRAIDYKSKPNLNVLFTLLLKRQLQAARGQANAASLTLGQVIRLARVMGLDKLGSQRDDAMAWTASAKSYAEGSSAAIHQDLYVAPILADNVTADADIAKAPWLSTRSTMTREAVRHLYAHLAVQDWIGDPLSTVSIPPSISVSLLLPLDEPVVQTEGYQLQSEDDSVTSSSMHVSRYLYGLARNVGAWKRDGRDAGRAVEVERALLEEPRPTSLQAVATSTEDAESITVQHMRTLADLTLHYCLFVIRRSEASLAEQCIEAADRVMQCRAELSASFPAPVHKFFNLQRYTLEAALMVVIYLHQYGSQLTEERRQALQASIDEAYAQPGFEHAHSLLSLNFDAQPEGAAAPASINGVKRSRPEEEEAGLDGSETVEPGQEEGLSDGQAGVGGMALSNGSRLAPSHPIVNGLRAFVHGQTLPFGSAPETVDFWDAIERHSQLFLIG